MSIAQIFFRKGNFISTIELDIIISEGTVATSRITQNPVEKGADVNDHRIVEPMTFTVAGVVSNISSNTIGQFLRVPTIFNQNNAKSKEAWEALLELQATGTGFTLVQNLKTYDNVFILSLSERQDTDTSNGLFFTATMKEIIFPGVEVITTDQFNDSSIADKMIGAVKGGLKQLKDLI